jgi:tRNA modification GTPase
MPLHIADTAGLREVNDVVEAEGIRRAREEMARADRILYVIDATRALDHESIERETSSLPSSVPVTWILNKTDLCGGRTRFEQSQPPRVHVSASSGDGIDLLRAHLKECMGFIGTDTGTISARRRHLDALARAEQHLLEASNQLIEHRAGELMAEELRQAQQALAEITGEFTSDDLLGKIFSSFCIGK